MKQQDVPVYIDPDSFSELGQTAKFPCSTNLMEYNALLHQYFLTPEGLDYYGINVMRRYMTDSNNKLKEFIRLVSKKVYDTINYKAGVSRYQVMLYRIAVAPPTVYPDRYFMRKQFEGALADQARFMLENGDKTRYTGISTERDEQSIPLKPEDTMRDLSDLSPETLRTLDALNLTRWFAMPSGIVRPDLTKY